MTDVAAPIATDTDRDAIAHLVTTIRPDWDKQGIKSALAKHPDQTIDVLTLQAITAAITRPDQRTPALLGIEGDHTRRARAALSRPQLETNPAYLHSRGRRCECGVYEDVHHRSAAVLDHHPFTPEKARTGR